MTPMTWADTPESVKKDVLRHFMEVGYVEMYNSVYEAWVRTDLPSFFDDVSYRVPPTLTDLRIEKLADLIKDAENELSRQYLLADTAWRGFHELEDKPVLSTEDALRTIGNGGEVIVNRGWFRPESGVAAAAAVVERMTIYAMPKRLQAINVATKELQGKLETYRTELKELMADPVEVPEPAPVATIHEPVDLGKPMIATAVTAAERDVAYW